ncbi:unnamed protein product, partial [Ectocarpus sp. 8 AP-2014]
RKQLLSVRFACSLQHHPHAFFAPSCSCTMPKTHSFFLVLFSTAIFTDVARAELPDFPMTLADMEVLAGYYSAGGKYLGGIPKAHTLSREIYECTDFQYSEPNNTASNATYCTGWSADESYGGGFQLGDCECKFGASNGAYCSDWICDQESSDYTFCQCDDTGAAEGLFCNAWSCKQISSGGRAEFEDYRCQRPSPSGHYCEAWNGNVTASDEFEIVSCECMANWHGDQVCSFWECEEELGLSTCSSAGASWCDLGVSIGVGGGIGLLGVLAICSGIVLVGRMNSEGQSDTAAGLMSIALGTVWCLSWSSGVVIWGGEVGATYVGIMWGVPIVLAAVVTASRCFVVYRVRTKDEQELPVSSA